MTCEVLLNRRYLTDGCTRAYVGREASAFRVLSQRSRLISRSALGRWRSA